MDCVFPGACNLESYWSNIVLGIEGLREAAGERLNFRGTDRFEARGGFIDDVAEFDVQELGLPPDTVAQASVPDLLVVGILRRAIADMDCGRRWRGKNSGNHTSAGLPPPNRTRILLAGLPVDHSAGPVRGQPSPLLQLGREGSVQPDYESALSAVQSAVEALQQHHCDLAAAVAVRVLEPCSWERFRSDHQLSSSGSCSPFSEDADGLVPGEGVGAVVLKRLSDAKRDGDRIYATIRGVGLSPRENGELLEGWAQAIRRAYQQSGVDPQSVSLVEGAGSARMDWDAAEISAMDQEFGKAEYPGVVLSSVKPLIGETLAAAGMAGILKVALALFHRVLPLTRNAERPHPALNGTRFYINTATTSWISPPTMRRNAGVNSLSRGLHGHVVLEEPPEEAARQLTPRTSEVFLCSADDRDGLLQRLAAWQNAIQGRTDLKLRDIAFTESLRFRSEHACRIAIVATTAPALEAQLVRARERLAHDTSSPWAETGGIYFSSGPCPGTLAFLFPGWGFPGLVGGYPERLGELCLHFPEVRKLLDLGDHLASREEVPYPLHHQLFPPPQLDDKQRAQITWELLWTERAPLGMMMANLATFRLMQEMGVRAGAMVGFSLGEWAALTAAGVLDIAAIETVVQEYLRGTHLEEGTWAIVSASCEQANAVLQQVPGIANVTIDASPNQVFIGGETPAVRAALEEFRKLGIWGQEFPIAIPYHTPLAAPVAASLKDPFHKIRWRTPATPVYCAMTASRYPDDPDTIRGMSAGNFVKPVRVRETIMQLYRDGVRVFVQLGSGGKFLPNIQSTLALEPHVAVSIDHDHRGGLEQFHRMIGQLAVLGVPLDAQTLFRSRPCVELDPQIPPSRRRSTIRVFARPPAEPVVATPLENAFQPEVARATALCAAPMVAPPVGRVMTSAFAVDTGVPTGAGVTSVLAEVVATMNSFLAAQEKYERSEKQLLQSFLETQQAAVMTLLGGAGGRVVSVLPAPAANLAARRAPLTAPAVAASIQPEFPLTGELVRLAPEQEMESRLVLDLDQHPFLAHHALIRLPDELRPAQDRLPTLPMTFAAEILAEAASALLPGKTAIAVRDIEARQWISIESGRTLALSLHARRVADDEVEAELRLPGVVRPAFRGKVSLADGYPAPPEPMTSAGDQPCAHSAQEFYRQGPLFHGELFRVITSFMKRSGNSIEAEVVARDPRESVHSPSASHVILDPVLVDGLTQVLGYPASLEGWCVFPHHVGRISWYGPRPAPGTKVRARLRYKKLDARRMQCDLDALGPDGQVWLRMEQHQPWRIVTPPGLVEFHEDRRQCRISNRWDAGDTELSCYRISAEGFGDLKPDWIARMYLGDEEWAQYRQHRRLDWLLGRVAAKDAICDWLQRHRGRLLYPVEVKIDNAENGAPVLVGPAIAGLVLSISHLEATAIAVATRAQGAGVDIMEIRDRDDSFRKLAFDSEELADLERIPQDSLPALHRVFCAKEAALKAQGLGLENLARLRFRGLSPDGQVELELRPDGKPLQVRTWLDGQRAIAIIAIR
jgi:acyl transferase domain-containing protein/4'-phosphopantetheinyl transferase EntD